MIPETIPDHDFPNLVMGALVDEVAVPTFSTRAPKYALRR
jgi:hypothetical protein